MAKILCRKKVYEYKKDCVDEFGKYNWYFNIYICFSKVGITWQIISKIGQDSYDALNYIIDVITDAGIEK